MAYIPPHKRVSQTTQGGGPPATAIQTTSTMVVKPEESLNLISSICGRNTSTPSHGVMVRIACHYISTWPSVPSIDVVDEQLPSSVICLVPICPRPLLGQKREEKQLILLLVNTSNNNNHLKQERNEDIKSCDMEESWTSLAETLHANMLSVFHKLSSKRVDQKLFLLARLGKVIYRWNPFFNRDFSGENNNPVSYSYLEGLRRNFCTDVPREYVEHVKNVAIPDLGFEFEGEKELFHLILDDLDDESIIRCKCRVLQGQKKVQVYKIENDPGRLLFQDINCLGSNVDIRLALYRKRTLLSLQDGEMQSIRDLISSAIIDLNVEGGLNWPLGTTSAGGQYRVRAVWHYKTEHYIINSSIKLKVRVADRCSRHSSGEVTTEVLLKPFGITNNVLDEGNEAEGVLAMLKDALVLIRSHFLAWDGRLVSVLSES